MQIAGHKGAVVALNVEDYFPQKKRWWLRLHEKNGKLYDMPCHHKLEDYLDAYIEAAGIADDRKGPLFRAAIGKQETGPRAMSRTDVWYMVRRRAADAGIETASAATPSAPPALPTISPTAAVSRSRNAWPDTRTRKPPGFTTGATMTSAWGKSSGSGFERQTMKLETEALDDRDDGRFVADSRRHGPKSAIKVRGGRAWARSARLQRSSVFSCNAAHL